MVVQPQRHARACLQIQRTRGRIRGVVAQAVDHLLSGHLQPHPVGGGDVESVSCADGRAQLTAQAQREIVGGNAVQRGTLAPVEIHLLHGAQGGRATQVAGGVVRGVQSCRPLGCASTGLRGSCVRGARGRRGRDGGGRGGGRRRGTGPAGGRTTGHQQQAQQIRLDWPGFDRRGLGNSVWGRRIMEPPQTLNAGLPTLTG